MKNKNQKHDNDNDTRLPSSICDSFTGGDPAHDLERDQGEPDPQRASGLASEAGAVGSPGGGDGTEGSGERGASGVRTTAQFIERLASSLDTATTYFAGIELEVGEYVRESYRDFMVDRPLNTVDTECAEMLARRIKEVDIAFAASEVFSPITLAYAGDAYEIALGSVFGPKFNFELKKTIAKAGGAA